MAFCHRALDIRQFRFDRILSLTLDGRIVDPNRLGEVRIKKIAKDALDDD
jgi:predicted DNA-binding transcriptional regulator YafY